MAGEPVILMMAAQPVEDGKRIHVLRPGAVYDPGGDLVGVITPELATEAARGANAWIAAGMVIPLSLDHGIEAGLRDQATPNERRASYGSVDSFEAMPDGNVYAVAHLNTAGAEFVAAHQGDAAGVGNSLRVSPCLHMGPLTHPSTGEKLSDAWIEVVSLTNAPRQSGLDPVILSRGMVLSRGAIPEVDVLGAGGVEALREAVEAAVRGVLPVKNGHIVVKDFDAERAVAIVYAYDAPDDEQERVYMLPIAVDRTGDSVAVTVTGPPVEGAIVESFEPLTPPAMAQVDTIARHILSRCGAAATIPVSEGSAEEASMSDEMLLARDDGGGAKLLTRLGMPADASGEDFAGKLLARLDKLDELEAGCLARAADAKRAEVVVYLDERGVDASEREFFATALLGDEGVATLARAALDARAASDPSDAIAEAITEAKTRGALPADFEAPAPVLDLARAGGDGLRAAVATFASLPDGAVVRTGAPAGTSAIPGDARATTESIAELCRVAADKDGITFGEAFARYTQDHPGAVRAAYATGKEG